MSTSLWTPKTSACHPPCLPVRGYLQLWKPSTAHPPMTDQGTARAGSRMASMNSFELRCEHGGARARRRGTVAPPGHTAGPRAEAVPHLAPAHDPPSPQGPPPDHVPGLGPALPPVPGPEAAAGHVPPEAAHAPGLGPGPSHTPLGGGVAPGPGAPPHPLQPAWVLTQHLPYQTQGLEKRIKATRCW